MIRADFHTHTTFCDGKNTPEEMVLGAIAKGMTAIGFSGHSYTPTGLDYCMTREGTAQYRKEIARLKEVYGDKINILCGLEQEFYAPDEPAGYDYVIGSAHCVCKDGETADVDASPERSQKMVQDWFGGDWYAAAENYFAAVAEIPKRWKVNFIGHIDLIAKFNEGGRFFDETHPRYVEAVKAAVDAILPYGLPFEVNTGAISRGWRTSPYPNPWILRYIAEQGGSVIFSGDAHSVEGLCCQFEIWEPEIRKTGVKVVEHP